MDESLVAWRSEVSMLSALAASASLAPSFSSSSAAHTAPHCTAPPGGAPPFGGGRIALLPPGGLAWVSQLHHNVQGCLAACKTPMEALDVLDEALDGLPPPRANAATALTSFSVAEEGSSRITSSTAVAPRGRALNEPPLEPCRARQVQAQRFAQAEVELVEASAQLLKEAQARAAGLKEELKERQRRHELKVAELRRRQHRERKKMLHRLLYQLSPPRQQLDSGHVPEWQTPSPPLSEKAGAACAAARADSVPRCRERAPPRHHEDEELLVDSSPSPPLLAPPLLPPNAVPRRRAAERQGKAAAPAAVAPPPARAQPTVPSHYCREPGARIRSRSEGSLRVGEADADALAPRRAEVVTQPGVFGIAPPLGRRTVGEDRKRTQAAPRGAL